MPEAIIDYDKVQAKIREISQALEDSDMGQVSTHLISLQQQLQTTPHLVDLLLPEDIGVLVTAERKRMQVDILAASMPKTRAKAKAKVKKPMMQLDMSKLNSINLEDF